MPAPSLTEEVIQMVKGALLAGMSTADASRTYQISKASVHRIKQKLDAERLASGEKPDLDLDELLILSLNKHLHALNTIAEVASDKDYLRGQRANDIASLHQEINNHTLRLLQSFSPEPEDEE